MQFIPTQDITNPTEFLVSLGQKGQITLPKSFRDKLNIRAKDMLVVRLSDSSFSVHPTRSSIEEIFQMGSSLETPLSDTKQTEIAWQEHVESITKKK